MPVRSRLIVVALLAAALLGATLLGPGLFAPAPAGAQAPGRLSIGFLDEVFTDDASERGPWLTRAADSGADIVRIDIGWPAPDTPARPPGFDARNPADPAYDFSRADAAIVDASARGLRVLAAFSGARAWVDGPGRPASAEPGTWKPDPQALEDYGAALARRYSGRFPDPARSGRMLPRVAAFQPWNEPNLEKYLSPQWSGGRTFAPAHYRLMLTGFYRGVKSASPAALVVSAGTAPFGDPGAGGRRIMPARFVREMLRLRRSGGRLRATSCPAPARFDVLAHHPYSVGFPRRPALNADDVSIPDIGKLTKLLRAGERLGGALPRIRHRLWVTEVSYDSSPPDPDGVPAARHARFLAETFYLLWRQGVDTITWYQVHDQVPVPSYATTAQSGVYFADGRPKPAQRAFRFPLVAERLGRGTVRVWGRSPVAGSVRIERRTAAGWRHARIVRARRHGTFYMRVRVCGSATLRARVGGETSLPGSAAVPARSVGQLPLLPGRPRRLRRRRPATSSPPSSRSRGRRSTASRARSRSSAP